MRARKVDTTQKDIVAALRKAGAFVWIIREPVDLLVWYQGTLSLMECKTPGRKRKDQPAQDALCKAFGIPRPTSAESALKAIGALREAPTPRPNGFLHIITDEDC